MNEEVPVISQDSYTLDDQFLKVAQKIFFKDSGEKELDISTQKNSIFGYMTQMGSLIARNGIWHRNALYDEFFLNTAAMDTSVYQKAKLYNYSINNATPAKCMLTFALKIAEIDSAIDNLESIMEIDTSSSVRVLTINKNTKFYFDDLVFMLPNSILITRSGTGNILSNDFIYQVAWDVNDYNLKEFSQTISSISSTIQNINNENYLVMKVVIYQMNVEEKTYQCVTQDTAEVIYFNTEITDELAGFEAYIDADGINTNEIDNEFFRIEKVFNDSSEGDGNEKYCYYAYPSENSLEIFFNPYPEYRPSYGATAKLRIFSTKGINGNVSYTGTITAEVDIMPKDQATPQIYSFSVLAKCITDPSNGKNRPTIKEIKKGIIKKLLYRDGLVTTRDLNTFFEEVMNITITGLNRNAVTFIKKRDDVLKRIYNAYLLLEDNDSHIIPTNTINLKIAPSDLEANRYRLKKGTSLIYDASLDEYRLLLQDEYPEDFIYEKKSLVYSLPYLLKVNFEPFLRCVYYRIDKSESISAKIIYNNSLSPFSHIINSLSIYRNSMFEDYYNIFFNLNSNVEDKYDKTTLTSAFANKGAYSGFLVRLLFTEDNKNERVLGYIDMKPPAIGSDTKTWRATINTEDIIDSDGKLQVSYNYVNPMISSNSTDSVSLSLPEKFRVKVLVCYSESAILDSPLFSVRKNLDEEYSKYNSYVPDGYAIMSIYTHDNDGYISFHKSLTNICFSDIVVKDSNYFYIKEIPVIGTKYLLDKNTNQKVSSALEEIEEIFLEHANSLENNTQMNVKFYNTFGAAQHYNCDYTNLFIKLKIALNSSYSLTLNNKIKNAIIQFVNDSNSIGRLSLSNLVRELEKTFTQIKYINVVGINDMGLQTIEDKYFNNLDAMTKEEYKKYVPEYLNVNMQLDDGILDYSIELEYL